MNNQLTLLLLIAAVIIVLFCWYNRRRLEPFNDFAHSFGIRPVNIPDYHSDQWNRKVKKNFVAWNEDKVSDPLKGDTPLTEKDKILLAAFNKIVSFADDSQASGNWHQVYPRNQDREQLSKYIVAVINEASGRTFEPLDIVAFKAEIKKNIGEPSKDYYKFSSTLFITEQYSENVNNWSKQIYYEAIKIPDSKIEIVRLELLGNNRDNLSELPGNDPNSNNYFRLLSKWHIQQPYVTTEDRVLFDDEATDRHLRDYYRKVKQVKYSCFGPDEMKLPEDNELDCINHGGKWDSPPESNADCPFYRSNVHYDNVRGGKMYDGTCEMPLGTKKLGYKQISSDPKHKPFCYNCKDSDGNVLGLGQCCEDQSNNRSRYPELEGKPDYAFRGDITERYNEKQKLTDKGLLWERYPNRIFDKHTNSYTVPQLDPVFNNIVGLKKDPQMRIENVPYNSFE